MSTEDLIESLRQQQGNEPDGAFAARLGVTREAWRKVRVGQLKPGRKMLKGIMDAYPTMAPQVLAFFLPENANILAERGKRRSA